MPDIRHDIANAQIVVTGPSGWVGSAMLATLRSVLGPGWSDQVRLFGSRARNIIAADGTDLSVRALESIRPADVDGALVIHLAYLTKEKVDELGEEQFVATNRRIDDALLNAMAASKPRALFVASSGAAAMAERGIDLHPYGVAKLHQEDRFLAWGADAGVPVLAGRIFNLAGPYINKVESYAVSAFILQALRAQRIEIAAKVPVFRSYLHVLDLCALAITALVRGVGRDRPIDLCGAEIVEMGEIAALVVRAIGSDIAVVREAIDCSRPSAYVGDAIGTKTLAMELGLQLAAFSDQVAATYAWIAARNAALI